MDQSRASGDPASYLALGDSYTIGEGVHEAERWPVQLVGLLRTAGVHIAEPRIVARTGWTTDELDAAIDAAALHPPYDLVSLLIGVNNQYRGRPLGEYAEQFKILLERAAGFAGGAGGRVLVLSVPDWGCTPFAAGRDAKGIAAEIDAFNAANRRIALGRGAVYVDITEATRELGAGPGSVVGDGLHPSAQVYEVWARRALPAALAVLRG